MGEAGMKKNVYVVTCGAGHVPRLLTLGYNSQPRTHLISMLQMYIVTASVDIHPSGISCMYKRVK